MSYMRVGVQLTRLKTLIFDQINASGDLGCTIDDLQPLVPLATRGTLKAHINQINDLLCETEYQIIGEWTSKLPAQSFAGGNWRDRNPAKAAGVRERRYVLKKVQSVV